MLKFSLKCFLAAGVDILLYNGSTTTVKLNPSVPDANISVFVPCDLVINEVPKRCSIVVDRVESTAIPDLVPDRNLRSARLRILDCPKEGEFCTVSG